MQQRDRSTAARKASGFTLVEVLVALVIMAIIAGMAWQGVDGIVRARDASQARLQQSLRLNTVIAQWEQDLASIQETPAVPPITFDGASLRLTRRAEGGVQVVVWSLRAASGLTAAGAADASTGNVWMRWAGPAVTTQAALQDAWLGTQQFQGVEPGQLRVIEGVSDWQLYFFREGAWTNPQSTGTQAPGTTFVPLTRNGVPAGVRLVLTLVPGPNQPREGKLTRDVALGPQTP